MWANGQNTKRCTKCGLDLPIDAFYTVHGKPESRCKECSKASSRARQQRKKERERSDYLATGAKIVYKV